MENRHQAYNTLTGEVITTTRGNYLKKIIAFKNRKENRWSTPEFCRQYAKSWRFNHKGGSHEIKYTVVVVYATGDKEEVYTTTEQHRAIKRVNAILAFNDGIVKDCYCKIN